MEAVVEWMASVASPDCQCVVSRLTTCPAVQLSLAIVDITVFSVI